MSYQQTSLIFVNYEILIFGVPKIENFPKFHKKHKILSIIPSVFAKTNKCSEI